MAKVALPQRKPSAGGGNIGSIVGGIGGAIAGGIVGNVPGAIAGYGAGSTLGGAVGGRVSPPKPGGQVPGPSVQSTAMQRRLQETEAPGESKILEESLLALREAPDYAKQYEEPLKKAYVMSISRDYDRMKGIS